MDKNQSDTHFVAYEMNSEEHYRNQAASYRKTAKYCQMVQIDPILKASIENCQGERLIA